MIRRHALSILFAALLPVVLRFSLLPYLPIPSPEVHDEFSYLLGADTLSSWRLTNPAHPMWVHFETFHVNQQPTYATKYLPGQSLFLAFGQRFFGRPWYGVVLSVALMCGCICWMLQGWLPPSYALVGAILAGMQFGVTSYWMDSYWGGALPAAGGALVLGALPRIVRHQSASVAALVAFGLVLLAFTRPYEGLILTISCTAVLVWWMRRERHPLRQLLTPRMVLPLLMILAGAFAWLGYYNYRVTGAPWLMPFAINQRMYAATPHFWLLPAGSIPTYRHEVIRKLWVDWDGQFYREARSNPLRLAPQLAFTLLYPLWTPLRLCLLVAIVLARTRKVRIALAIASVLILALLMEKAASAHYFAPATALLFLMIVAGWRYMLRVAQTRSATARKVAVLLLAGSVVYSFGTETLAVIRQPHEFAARRSEIVAQLMHRGPRHVVFVRYAPDHDIHTEWVYNRADIDSADIVWARDMGETDNIELLDYYRERQAWLLDADMRPPRLTEYSVGERARGIDLKPAQAAK